MFRRVTTILLAILPLFSCGGEKGLQPPAQAAPPEVEGMEASPVGAGAELVFGIKAADIDALTLTILYREEGSGDGWTEVPAEKSGDASCSAVIRDLRHPAGYECMLRISSGSYSVTSDPYTFETRPMHSIHLDFMDFKGPAEPGSESSVYTLRWPFSSPAYEDMPRSMSSGDYVGKHGFAMTGGGPEILIVSEDTEETTAGGVWINSWHGLCFNSGYIRTPALEGRRLSQIVWEPSPCTYTYSASVADESGRTISGGQTQSSPFFLGKDERSTVDREHIFELTFILKGTEAGASYRFCSERPFTFTSVKEITFIYE